ncbi:hypothetical protein FSY75_04300 [Streptomyces sp. TR1341]|uniref:DUF3566 domain-containing protein n=4 Tax=Streptomyces TaxID=1883 RepID=A0A7W3RM68_STRMR|nr:MULTISPECIES: DUF3566 domain-containing protein [Streptomyces]NDK23713.1 hypothetical protein [Streptomyces sp. TR1341]MBA9054751.1 hypothetical protein [Streptomyces murinus]UWW89423.1 hypothetical protein GO605_00040 [Streptomyces murinus]WSI86516.1 DUF3566 domain-containing protein [Streptomyces murinus]WUD08228.1 DUF3566 domain-containing protein [Streptomyces murinus]
MSGATGAGSAGTSTGTETDGGGRGSAAHAGTATDPHTTNLKPVRASAADASGESAPQGGTVTDTRGPAAAGEAQSSSPLPGERRPEQPGGPYHPPQAYPAQPAAGGVRRPRTGVRTAPRTRKARLRVAKADPWSVMKVSFLLSIALGICTIVASAVLWMVMDAMGVFSTVGGTISEATGSNEANGFDLQSFLSLPHVLMFTTIIAAIDVVLATALATLAAFIYNLSAGFVGGVELTLAEDE